MSRLPVSLASVCFVIVSAAALAGGAAPAPPALSTADLPDPYPWPSHIFTDDPVPLDFEVDLDLLAPLGTRPDNGALWFAHFSKRIGDRIEQVEAAQASARPWTSHDKEHQVLPPDHPLLLEAEPWIECASWSFYPEVWSWQGGPTPISNLLFALQLGRSWVARGEQAEDPAAALADYRRTIRLGRLLLQDDVVYIQNLVGVALVRVGVEAIYGHARARGDGATAALAALAIQDCTALRLELTRRFQRMLVFMDFVARVPLADGGSRTELRLPDQRLDDLVRTATSDPCRALRIEVATPLWITSHLGTEAQRAKARETLAAMTNDPDELVATAARLAADRTFDADQLEAHWTGAEPTAAR